MFGVRLSTDALVPPSQTDDIHVSGEDLAGDEELFCASITRDTWKDVPFQSRHQLLLSLHLS